MNKWKIPVLRQLQQLFSRPMNLHKQIALTMMAMLIFITVFLGATLFQISKNTIEHNYQSAHLHNLQVSSKVMDIYLESLIEKGRTLLENERFIDIMESETGNNSYFSSRNQLEIDKTFGEIAAHDALINGMLVVNEKGNWRYYAKSKVYSGALNHFYTTDKLLNEDWVQVAKEAEGKEAFYPYDVLLKERAKDCFCYVKNLINPYTQTSFGYLVVSIDKKIWSEAFGKDDEGYATNRYMVLQTTEQHGDDRVAYFNGQETEQQQILEDYYRGDHSMRLFSVYKNNTTDWSVMNIITKEELESDSERIRKILVLVILIMILVSMVAATAISSRISKPLDKLAETMALVEVGNLKVETEFDNSEVGTIGNRFKRLVNNNLELRDRLLNLEIKEKEAQLHLLQSQINPHFLYNTLDALYLMALIEQADDIAEMVQALSNMFKLSLNKGEKMIALRDEIEHMLDYMKIQNFRFHDRYILQIDVDKEILDHKILTFMLQPILENAVYHGLESKVGQANILLTAKRTGDYLYFAIKDDGVGIEDMTCIEKGYGIRNINERIKLFYGEAYQVKITSELGIGTKVEIVIPIQ